MEDYIKNLIDNQGGFIIEPPVEPTNKWRRITQNITQRLSSLLRRVGLYVRR